MFEAIVIACLALMLVAMLLILNEVRSISSDLFTFIQEFRVHFDDAFVRKIMKKIVKTPMRKL